MPILVKVSRVLLVEDVPVFASIDLQPLDPHLSQLGHSLLPDYLFSFLRHLEGPLVVADLAVDLLRQ